MVPMPVQTRIRINLLALHVLVRITLKGKILSHHHLHALVPSPTAHHTLS
jgi:hypothetical protein